MVANCWHKPKRWCRPGKSHVPFSVGEKVTRKKITQQKKTLGKNQSKKFTWKKNQLVTCFFSAVTFYFGRTIGLIYFFRISQLHLMTALICRFIKLYTSLRDCTKIEVRNLFQIQRYDMHSIFGRNCFNLCREFDMNNIASVEFQNVEESICSELWYMSIIN